MVRHQMFFEKAKNAESEISFRCSKCGRCKICKEHNQKDILSVRQEADVINNSVEINTKNRVTIASHSVM